MTFCRPDVLSFLFWLYVVVKNEFMSDRCKVIFYVITSGIKKNDSTSARCYVSLFWLYVCSKMNLGRHDVKSFFFYFSSNLKKNTTYCHIFMIFRRRFKLFCHSFWIYVGPQKMTYCRPTVWNFILNFCRPSYLDIISARFKYFDFL
jgi:hypothetical protein